MRRPIIFFSVLSLFAGGFSVVVVWQRQSAGGLRAEVELQREQVKTRAELAANIARLRAEQISAADLEALRGDRAALLRLRGEIDALRRRAEECARVVAAKAVEAAKPREPSILDGPLPASAWKNAGSATPAAALETVLWAAAGGEVDALAGLLRFDVGVRARVDALFAGLPEPVRTEYGTPERLIAALTARDVPLGKAKLFDTKADFSGDRWIQMQLYETEGKALQGVLFSLRPEGGTWGLVVPASAVEKYAVMLKRKEPDAGK
jgi:hypothetical protein